MYGVQDDAGAALGWICGSCRDDWLANGVESKAAWAMASEIPPRIVMMKEPYPAVAPANADTAKNEIAPNVSVRRVGSQRRPVFCGKCVTRHMGMDVCEPCRFADGQAVAVVRSALYEPEDPVAASLNYDAAWQWAHERSDSELLTYYEVIVVPLIAPGGVEEKR
ncbi:MAG: hypothetical protein PHR35_08585 [Kiritimatiellae bacterium]|nr:hypothetical protein [Kiritimatiellia bacterium]